MQTNTHADTAQVQHNQAMHFVATTVKHLFCFIIQSRQAQPHCWVCKALIRGQAVQAMILAERGQQGVSNADSTQLGLCPAESIAFYNGEMREVGVASRCLNNLISIGRLRIKWSAWLSLWTNCYSYATILAPAFITAPMYFRGEIEFGIISQVAHFEPSMPSASSHLSDAAAQACFGEVEDSLQRDFHWDRMY